jgi:hypothetical protein
MPHGSLHPKQEIQIVTKISYHFFFFKEKIENKSVVNSYEVSLFYFLSKYLEIDIKIPGFPERCANKLATFFVFP